MVGQQAFLDIVPVSQCSRAAAHAPRRRVCTAQVEIRSRVEASPRASRVCLAPLKHWTNPKQELIIPRGEGLYTIDRTYYFFDAFDVGSRCTVIVAPFVLGKRPKVLLYSPIPIDDQLRSKLRALGDVSLIFAPNNEHIDFVASAKAAFPDATVLGPPGCRTRWPHLPFDSDIFVDGVPHAALLDFQHVITPLYVPAAPFLNETVLVHRPTRTLVVCDIWWNIPNRTEAARLDVHVPPLSRVAAFTLDRVYAPIFNRFLVNDRAQFARFYAQLAAQNFHRIIPCHGNCLHQDAKQVLDAFFPKFLRVS